MKTICLFIIAGAMGGAENVVLSLVRGLDRRRIRPIMIINDEIRSHFNFAELGIAGLNLGPLFPSGRLSRAIHARARLLVDVISMRVRKKHGAIESFLRDNSCSVVNTHSMYDLAAALALKRNGASLRVVGTIHGFLGLDPTQQRLVHSHTKYLKLLAECDSLICVSEAISSMVKEKIPNCDDKLFVIENGVDRRALQARRSHRGRSEGMVISFCGGDKEVKGGHILRDALGILSNEGRLNDVTIRVMGPVQSSSEWLTLRDELGSVIQVAGFLDKSELYRNIAESHLVVMPSLTEGHPIIALEALGMGVPVISSDIPGFQGIAAQENMFDNNPIGLAGMLRTALTDSEYLARAQKYALGFMCRDWSEVCEDYRLVLQELDTRADSS